MRLKFLPILLFAAAVPSLLFAAVLPEFSFKIPVGAGANESLAYFGTVSGMFIDSAGNLYVSDSGKSQIQKFGSDGYHELTFGTYGTGYGQIKNPKGVAVDASGNIYVLDAGNSRIQVFDSAGTFTGYTFGSQGPGQDQLSSPSGMVLFDGKLYVGDTGNKRIQVFTLVGENTQTFPVASSLGFSLSVDSVAVDPSGNVYAAASQFTNYVIKLNSSGTRVSEFVTDIAGGNKSMVFSGGSLYVGSETTLKKYTNDVFVSNRSLSSFVLAADSYGNIYAAGDSQKAISKYDSSWTLLWKYLSLGPIEDWLGTPKHVAVDSAGNFYVTVYSASNSAYGVKKLSPSGEVLSSFLTENGGGLFAEEIAVDSSGNLYVGTNGSGRVNVSSCIIARFDSSGQYSGSQYDLTPDDRACEDGIYYSDIAIGGSGRVYGVDDSYGVVDSYDPTDGTKIYTHALPEFANDIAADSDENLYLVETSANRIEKIDSAGNFVSYIGVGQLSEPWGAFVDSSDNLYVADTGNNLIRKYNSAGALVYSLPGDGSSDTSGLFYQPYDVAINSDGTMAVADKGNNRLMVFNPPTDVLAQPLVSAAVMNINEGSSGSFTVSLATQPTDNVTINFSTVDPTNGTAATTSVSSLTFTPANWETEQTVTVTVPNDSAYSGNRITTIVPSITSSDAVYGIFEMTPITVGILEDEISPTPRVGCEAKDSSDLCEQATYEIESRLSGLTANDTTRSVWTTRVKGLEGWARNPSFWGSDLNFTGVSPWNSYGNYNRAGTLITPKHLLFADHYGPMPYGMYIVFVAQDNTVVVRQLVAQVEVGATDIRVGMLNEAVTDNIKFYSILSYDLLKTYFSKFNIPIVDFNQFDKPLIRDFTRFGPGNIPDNGVTDDYPPSNTGRYAFTGNIIGGDSGDAMFLIAKSEPILLGTRGTVVGGQYAGRYINEINSAIVELGDDDGYRVSTPDLSAFAPNVPPAVETQAVSLVAGSPVGTAVGTVQATDSYGGDTISYSIESGNTSSAFMMDSATGRITVNNPQSIDPNTRPQYNLVVKVTDNWLFPASATSTFTVNITSNSKPVFAARDSIIDVGKSTPAGTVVGSVPASDPDPGQSVSYSVLSGNDDNLFEVNSNGDIVTEKDAIAASKSQYVLRIQAIDDSYFPQSSTKDVTVKVGSNSSFGGNSGKASSPLNPPPINPTSPSISDLLVKIANLKQILAQLQNQNSPNTPPATTVQIKFTRNLGLGDKGPDVKLLQQYLNAHGYVVASSGPGSLGEETEVFGHATQFALKLFQRANQLPASGWFGPLTRNLLGK